MEKGNLSINSDNILPIIKKWLYSDTDIFIRELVSNGSDAITKYNKLIDMGEIKASDEKFEIHVRVDKDNKKIFIEDNGIGMTGDEVKKYINEIAFSGATDFVNKYNDKMDSKSEIIGHFGLGFYSSFMVADTVEIDTLSYIENSKAVNWTCEGGIEYSIKDSKKNTRGTLITLHINEDSKEFLNVFKLKEILKKYCSFIPVDIYFDDLNEKPKTDDDGNVIVVEKKPINNKTPLWTKQPSECTDKEYKDFYREVFHDFNDPLFWIHLNVDYPFNLKGILYFPKLKHELEAIEGQVKLYNNQVFIAENIKEVIPEFLLLLKGVIDCPDLPLNVSRSFLQNDGFVTKMSSYITKKVADKLNSEFKNDRETFTKYWDDINQFIKYGCIKDRSFYEKVNSSLLFKNINDDYITLDEYIEKSNSDDDKATIYYATDLALQSQYVKMFKENNLDAFILPTKLDPPFISYIEQYNEKITFKRIDSDISDIFEEDEENDSNKELVDLFKSNVNKNNLEVKVSNLKSSSISSIIVQSEEARRMKEMSQMFGDMPIGDMPTGETVILNKNNKLVEKLIKLEDEDKAKLICEHIYDLALISYKGLDDKEMITFIERNNKILEELI